MVTNFECLVSRTQRENMSMPTIGMGGCSGPTYRLSLEGVATKTNVLFDGE